MAECDKHEMIGCTICSGKYSTRVLPPKPKKAKPVRAPLPEALRIAEAVAGGKLCPECLTATGGIGCQCSRQNTYQVTTLDSQKWLLDNEEAFIRGDKDAAAAIKGARQAITGLAFSTLNRASLRAGLTDAEREADRLDILERFNVEPDWHAARNQQGSHLPV